LQASDSGPDTDFVEPEADRESFGRSSDARLGQRKAWAGAGVEKICGSRTAPAARRALSEICRPAPAVCGVEHARSPGTLAGAQDVVVSLCGPAEVPRLFCREAGA